MGCARVLLFASLPVLVAAQVTCTDTDGTSRYCTHGCCGTPSYRWCCYQLEASCSDFSCPYGCCGPPSSRYCCSRYEFSCTDSSGRLLACTNGCCGATYARYCCPRPDSNPGSVNSGIIVGVVIGVLIIVVFHIVLIVYCCSRYRKGCLNDRARQLRQQDTAIGTTENIIQMSANYLQPEYYVHSNPMWTPNNSNNNSTTSQPQDTYNVELPPAYATVAPPEYPNYTQLPPPYDKIATVDISHI